MTALLRPGDRVAVATRFGDGPIEEHTAIGIYAGESDALPAVPWSALTDRAIVVDLDNQHWAYGCQLHPVPRCVSCDTPTRATCPENGDPMCAPCWRSALAYGHSHGLHVDEDGDPACVPDCPHCTRPQVHHATNQPQK